MGHVVFIFLHILAIAFGLIGLFLTIPLHLIYAAASKRTPQIREDGKKKNTGILGEFKDNAEINLNMRDCPYCLKKVMKAATRCPHCQSDIDAVPITRSDRRIYTLHQAVFYAFIIFVVVVVIWFVSPK
jgi:hypothetical protein